MSIQSFKQISQEFFESCENLSYIQEPFQIENADNQYLIRDLENEFELIRALTQTKKHRMKLRSNTMSQNKKNRYPEQSIYQHSRVILKEVDDKNNQYGYINANYISYVRGLSNDTFKIIMSQGPTDNTINDFKQMIKQQNIQCVVMLCRFVQNGKNRCCDYIGDCQSKELQNISNYLFVKKINLGEQYANHQYSHVYYSEWPDKKVPSELNHISNLINHIKHFKNIVIHCSAGLGRSGVIAAILMIINSLQLKKQNKLSIFKQVRKMRQHRFGAVQNSQQYAFLYQFFKNYSQNII